MPDPGQQFLVEVEEAEVGVGAILSEKHFDWVKPHPCAFFSWRLTETETNYDIGNHELL